MITVGPDGGFWFDPGPDAELVFALSRAWPQAVPAPAPVLRAFEQERTVPLTDGQAREVLAWIVGLRDWLGRQALDSPDPASAVDLVGQVTRLAQQTERAVGPD